MSKDRLHPTIGIVGLAGSGKDTTAGIIQRELFKRRIAKVELYAFADAPKRFIKSAFELDDTLLYDRVLKETPIKFNMSNGELRRNFNYAFDCVLHELNPSSEFCDVHEEIVGYPCSKSRSYSVMYNKFLDVISSETYTPFIRRGILGKIFSRYIDNDRIYFKTTPRRLIQLVGTEFFRECVRESVWTEVAPYRDTILTDVRFPNEAQAVIDKGGILIKVVNENITSGTSESSHASESFVDEIECDYVVNNEGISIMQLTEEVDRIINKEFYAK